MQDSPNPFVARPSPAVLRELRRGAMRLEAVVALALFLSIVILVWALGFDASIGARAATGLI